MRHASFFYRGVEDGSAAVGYGIAQGFLEIFPVLDEPQLPDGLKAFVDLLIEREALDRTGELEVSRPAEPTRLIMLMEDNFLYP